MGGLSTSRVISKEGLRGFDKEARRLVVKALDEGWTGRISSKGHAILRHPDGTTISISRDMSNWHTRKDVEYDILRKTTRVSKIKRTNN